MSTEFDFSHIADDLMVDGKDPQPFSFDQLRQPVEILTLPATDDNPQYRAARLKIFNQQSKSRNKGMTAAIVDQARENDRKLMSKYCAKSWSGNPPKDKDGKDVPFSSEACYQFFKALPDWYFDEYRSWATNPISFVDLPEGDEDSLEELGNSLPTT